jgi:virulence factor
MAIDNGAMLKVALIGCGAHAAEAHATPLAMFAAEHPGQVELAAAVDVRPDAAEGFCRRFGFGRAFTDIDQMLATVRPDAVWCIVPPPFITATAGRLLERGIPTVIEKPLGVTVDEARQLAEVARRTGTPHMVSVNRRFVPRLNRAIAWARDHGPLQYVRVSMFRDRRTEDDFLFATGIHAVDAIRHIAGDVAVASVTPLTGEALASRWHLIDLHFASGARGRIDMLTTAGSHAENYELLGEGYRVELQTRLPRGTTSALRCYQGDRLVLEDLSPPDELPQLGRGEVDELREFITALQQHRRPRPGVEDVLPSMELCLALHRQALARQ